MGIALRGLAVLLGTSLAATEAFAHDGVAIVAGTDPVADSVVTFGLDAPGVVKTTFALSGLAAGEHVRAIALAQFDMRTYGLTNQYRLYAIDPASGVCSQIGPGPLPNTTIGGSQWQMAVGVGGNNEFRVVSETGENRQINPFFWGAASSFPAFNVAGGGPTPHVYGVTAVPFPPEVAPLVAAIYFGVDAQTDTLLRETQEFSARVATVGPLGFDLGSVQGFAADPIDRTLRLYGTPAGGAATHVYSIDRVTGAATDGGALTVAAATACLAPRRPADVVFVSDQNLRYEVTLNAGVNAAAPAGTYGPPDYGTPCASTTIGPYVFTVYSSGQVTRRGDGEAERPWGLPILGLIGRCAIAAGDGTVVVANGTRIVRMFLESAEFAPEEDGAYADGDPNVTRTPNVIALCASLDAGGGSTADVFALDYLDATHQWISRLDTTTGELTTIGSALRYMTTTQAAMTTLPDGTPILACTNAFSGDTDFCVVDVPTGTCGAFASMPALPNGAHIVGLATPTLASPPPPPPAEDPPVCTATSFTATLRLPPETDEHANPDDVCTWGGSIAFPASLEKAKAVSPYAGRAITVDLAGLTRTFTPDAKGNAVSDHAKLSIKVGKKGKPDVFKFSVAGLDFSDVFADEGLDGVDAAKNETHTLTLTITLAGLADPIVSRFDVIWNAKAGKKGTAKLEK